MRSTWFALMALAAVAVVVTGHVEDDDDEAMVEDDNTVVSHEEKVQPDAAAEEVVYVTPDIDPKVFFAEHFDHTDKFDQKWVKSSAKKDGAEAGIDQ